MSSAASFIVDSLVPLFERVSLVAVLVFLFFQLDFFRKALKPKGNVPEKILLALVFGLLSIYGTLRGIKVLGAIANIRDLAPIMAGILGGPLAGLVAGLIGGSHRYLAAYKIGTFTMVPCSLSTVLAGTIAGFLSGWVRQRYFLVRGMLLAAALEVMHMVLILLIARPFSQALALVFNIGIPMICANAFGLAVIYLLIKDQLRDND